MTSLGPVQRPGRVEHVQAAGAYRRMRLAVPDVGERAQPGQFVAVAVGGEVSSLLLRRSFAVYRSEPGAVEVVVAAHGPGTQWLVDRRPGDVLDVVGPLGTPFPDPDGPGPVLVVGGGYGAAALVTLTARLRAQGRPVTALLGAATEARLFGADDLEALGAEVVVSTDDGSRGTPGRVTDLMTGAGASVLAEAAAVYACGPMAMLAATAAVAVAHDVTCWCSVEESMACGIGVCMTCVLPVVGDDGRTRMTRSCVSGPTFDGRRVRWDAVGTVPADTVGAPAGGGH